MAWTQCLSLTIYGSLTANALSLARLTRPAALQGVYCGGMHHANCMVKEGHVAPHRFRLLAGYVGWGPGLLNEELLERKWWALAASAPLIISFLQGTAEAWHC